MQRQVGWGLALLQTATGGLERTALLLLLLNFIEPLLCLEKVFKGFIIHDRNLQISRVPLKSQAQGTSLFVDYNIEKYEMQ